MQDRGFSRIRSLYLIDPYFSLHNQLISSSLCFSCFYQDMADGGGGVIATEKYGSQESWRYRIKDGGMRRERTGQERVTRGKSITDAFKVRHLCQSLYRCATLRSIVEKISTYDT